MIYLTYEDVVILNIGEKIKYLRKMKKLTQEELAKYVGTTKQTIHKYETGIITNIPASKIKLMSKKLDTTPAYLMGWTNETNWDETNESKHNIEQYTNRENELIKKYRILNEEGKNQADIYIADLTSITRYIQPMQHNIPYSSAASGVGDLSGTLTSDENIEGLRAIRKIKKKKSGK